MSIVNVTFINVCVCVCVCVCFVFGFEGGMLDVIVLFPNRCLSFYFVFLTIYI